MQSGFMVWQVHGDVDLLLKNDEQIYTFKRNTIALWVNY